MGDQSSLEVIMSLILHSGNAKSNGVKAIQAAKERNFKLANQLIEEADNELVEAHHSQTSLLTKEAAGENLQVTLLMVHAQDHLMTAITFLDLAKELIYFHKEFDNLKSEK